MIPVETKGYLWYFKYPIKNPGKLEKKFITVATTRPETMLGDTAVAVNPNDKRWKPYIGKMVVLPLVGPRDSDRRRRARRPRTGLRRGEDHARARLQRLRGRAPAQSAARQSFRSQARLKIQGNPAFIECNLGAEDWQFLRPRWPRPLRGAQARGGTPRSLGLVEKIEPHTLKVPYGDRSHEVIEPYLTDQWYVDAKTLAQPALAAVREGKTTFIPGNWQNVYFQWLDNIQPWCISRQLWWGHRIPAWYGRKRADLEEPGIEKLAREGELTSHVERIREPIEDDPLSPLTHGGLQTFVAASEEEAIKLARDYYGRKIKVLDRAPLDDHDPILDKAGNKIEPIWRDEDVLDTWFSSALWPFSTLGWPDKTPELKRYYPTSVLVTGFDIIFFWVARMMMMGMHFMEDVPFHDVYIHALVRDEKGAKMSKSKGNVVDPLDVIDGCDLKTLIEKRTASILDKEERRHVENATRKEFPKGLEGYGTDALRFFMAAMAAPGRDVKLSLPRIEGYRNFATKLWNAARFCEMNGCARQPGFEPAKAKTTLNKWLYAETSATVAAVTEALEAYRFHDAAAEVYRFVWNRFCDWYVEFAKPVFMGSDEAAKAETQAMAAWALDEILKLLHPFMPFITEELWAVLGEDGPKRETLLCLAEWPKASKKTDGKAVDEVNWVIGVISEIRSLRSEMNVPPASTLPLTIAGADKETKARAKRYESFLKRMARLSSIVTADTPPQGSVQFVLGEATMALALANVIDLAAERERLAKEIGKLEAEIQKIDARFANEQFMAKAPEEVVEENRERRADAEATVDKLKAALKRLAALAA